MPEHPGITRDARIVRTWIGASNNQPHLPRAINKIA